ncbi:MAG: fimbrillin family protein [Prevotella sp.]|nr:fimbrillin family protein [Prevotella sp.]
MKKILFTILAFVGMMTSCSDETAMSMGSVDNMPINISAEYPVKGVSTRATDNGFQQGDAVGLFVVDYNPDGTPGTLLMKGNRADNVKFDFDGTSWTANYQLFWANKNTPADFYGYYPFNAAMQSITEQGISVYANQDGTTGSQSNYEQSDLLWAKAEKVQPTTDCIQLKYHHLMAGITVQLQMGSGFEASEWMQLEKTVLIDNVITESTVNMQTGTVTVKEGATTNVITPLIYNNTWRAVVVPQTLAAGKRVLNITVDGKNYGLAKDKDVQFIGGKMHNFTITVNRNTSTGEFTFELTADDIVAWMDDADLHDGLVRQYIVVDVSEPGILSKLIAERGIEADKVTALKITGNVNGDDLNYVRENCAHLSDYNLAKVTLSDGVLSNCGIPTMRHFVYPEKGMVRISTDCFAGAGSLLSNLVLPEGLVYIDDWAFGGWGGPKFMGDLVLPSTLRYLHSNFGNNASFSGELLLPEGIIEAEAPAGNFTGSLYFPSSLKRIYGSWGYSGITGTITIPRCMTNVSGFGGGGYNHVEFHDGITEIGDGAFARSNLSGELVLPPHLRFIGGTAFATTKISKIIFNDELRILSGGAYSFEGTFCDNPYLTGTLTLPKNVTRITEGCFRNCSGITGLIIPANVDIIEDIAFENCSGIASIVCEGTDPPVLGERVFHGVNKGNFTVEVPKGCVNKYKEADGWKEFKRIAEYSNFVCRPAHANALNMAHSENIVLNADGAWTVKYQPDWVRLSKTSGSGKTEIQLTFAEMNHGNGNRQDRIVFEMDGHETYCDVSQYDYEHDEDGYLTLQSHSQGNGIDIVFMGDGWDGESISNGDYLNMVREQMEYFFGIEPYKSHRDYFNVYVTFPLSQEKGVNTMHTYVNNRFGTLYGYDGGICTRNQLLTETDEIFRYATEHSPLKESDRWKAQLILIPNNNEYEGITYYDGNCALSICPPSNRPYPQDTRGVVQHEACGHGFGKLGDENITKQAWATPDVLSTINDYHGRGWMMNLATTSKMSQVAWADFIYDQRYSDQVDVFEGGYGYMRGVFRCENNSCMNYGIPYFNAMSRFDIMRRIREYSGTGFSMEYFYEHDTNKWGDRDGQTRSGATYASLRGNAITSSNMHRTPIVVKAKGMGDSVRKIRENLKLSNNR